MKNKIVIPVAALLVVLIYLLSSLGPWGSRGGGKNVLRLLSTETDPASVEIMKRLVTEFERTHPNVTIATEFLGFEAMYPKITAGIAAGAPPDIVGITNEETLALASRGQLEAVSSLIDAIGRDDFFVGALGEYEGEDYYVPYAMSILNLYYRTDLFEQHSLEPPKTWADMLRVCERLTLDHDGDGTVDLYGTAIPLGNGQATVNFFCTLLFSNEGHILAPDGSLVLGKGENRLRVLETIRFIAALARFSPPGSLGYEWKDLTAQFYAKTVASTYYAGRVIGLTERHAPGTPIGAAAYPYAKHPASATFSDGWAIVAGSVNRALAGELIQHLVSGQGYIDFLHTVPLHMTPPRRSVGSDPRFLANDFVQRYAHIKRVIDATANDAVNILAESGTMQPKAADIIKSQVIEEMLQRVVSGDATAEDALDDAVAKLKDILGE